VQPLEKAGLLRVARSPTDARTRIVMLTRAGERMIEAAYPLWEQAQKRIRDSFGGKRVDALRVQLAELVALAPRLDDVEMKTPRSPDTRT
jgi:DNA-binding MarR family transcriptional regulator